jgi:hypothetical protein
MTDRSVIAYPAILHFSESRHYIREVSPANTMAYDKYSPSGSYYDDVDGEDELESYNDNDDELER